MHSCSDGDQVLYALGHCSAYTTASIIPGGFGIQDSGEGPVSQGQNGGAHAVKRDQYEDWDSPGTGRDMSTAAVDSCLSVAQCVHVDAGWIEVKVKAKATPESQCNVKKLRRINTGDVIPSISTLHRERWTVNRTWLITAEICECGVVCFLSHPRVCLSVYP